MIAAIDLCDAKVRKIFDIRKFLREKVRFFVKMVKNLRMSEFFTNFALKFSSSRTKCQHNKTDASAARDHLQGALWSAQGTQAAHRGVWPPQPRRLTYQCECSSVAVGERRSARGSGMPRRDTCETGCEHKLA